MSAAGMKFAIVKVFGFYLITPNYASLPKA